jgi:hypothetical protein
MGSEVGLFLSSTWGRADQQTPRTQIESGRFVLHMKRLKSRRFVSGDAFRHTARGVMKCAFRRRGMS